MGTITFSTLQVTAPMGERDSMKMVAARATELGLVHTGVHTLPHNSWLYLSVLPSGSKADWPEEQQHLDALHVLFRTIEAYNRDQGGIFLTAVQLRVQDNPCTGDPVANITYQSTRTVEMDQ
jgi:hypothetical protein